MKRKRIGLSRTQFEEVFGIKLKPILRKTQREKCTLINKLFDEVCHLYGVREKALFEYVYPNNFVQVQAHLSRFLRDVRTCPKEVIEQMQQLLHEAT